MTVFVLEISDSMLGQLGSEIIRIWIKPSETDKTDFNFDINFQMGLISVDRD